MLHFRIPITGQICDEILNAHMSLDVLTVKRTNLKLCMKPAGPLHPWPIPDKQGDSVTINFIGPLPINRRFNLICSMTDHLVLDIQLIPTISTLTADGMVLLFFNHWYYENGLPLMIVCNQDKLFISCFWRSLHKLIGVSVKMSSAYHPEKDGASE